MAQAASPPFAMPVASITAGTPDLDHRVVIGAHEDRLFRHRIGRQLHPHGCAGLLEHTLERRMARAVRDDIGEVVQEHRHVEVDRGGHALDRHGGIVGEVLGARAGPSLPGVGDHQNRAARPLGRGRECAGDLDQRGDPGAVVERAVVDPIAGPLRLDADVIGVSHQRDIFILQPGIGSLQSRRSPRGWKTGAPWSPPRSPRLISGG